jgi:hypothetical protein
MSRYVLGLINPRSDGGTNSICDWEVSGMPPGETAHVKNWASSSRYLPDDWHIFATPYRREAVIRSYHTPHEALAVLQAETDLKEGTRLCRATPSQMVS